MNKMSKKNQDPHQIDTDRQGLEVILNKKCQHFAVGTYVVCKNVRGLITGESPYGMYLSVDWEDGTTTIIKNPASILNWRRNGSQGSPK